MAARYGGKISYFSFGAMSAVDGRAYRLKYDLEKYPSVTEELRKNWQAEMKSLPQFLTMNTEILALALVILRNLEEQNRGENGFSLKDIRRELDINIDIEYPPQDKETFTIGLRKKEDVFRYIRAILSAREERNNPQE